MLGIVPAAGRGSRIQPLGFSKELLPVGSRIDGEVERPLAVSEYLLQRMIAAGADKICFVIGPGKSDILEYYAAGYGKAATVFVVQPTPAGLCDAIFSAAPLVRDDEQVLIGLPDTVWYPEDGFAALPDDVLSFLLFPVDKPQHFDAVLTGPDSRVREIQVKMPDAQTNWVWGAFKMPGCILHDLHALWRRPARRDEYVGTLVNAYLTEGGQAFGVKAGTDYVDVGTFNGYRAAIDLLARIGMQSAQEVSASRPNGDAGLVATAGSGG